MKTNHRIISRIETLEPRIAPAAISIVGKTATWTDYDGDRVTLKWTSTDAPAFDTTDRGLGLQVDRIALTAVKHDGASFTLSVKAAGSGDGRIEIGHLDGTGVALKSWIGASAGISEVDLGNGTVGIGKLVMGAYGQTRSNFFPGSMGDDVGNIMGSVGSVKINGDLSNGQLNIGGDSTDKIGSVNLAGSIRGDVSASASFNGYLSVSGFGGSILIGGDVIGSATNTISGNVTSNTGDHMKSFVVKGSVVRGYVSAHADSVVVVGSVMGGKVFAYDPKTVFIGGSLVAKDGNTSSGRLYVSGNAASITVRGDLRGGDRADWQVFFSGLGVEDNAGSIAVVGSVKTLNVGGSIYAGYIANGDKGVNGGIEVTGNIGTLNIGGSLFGNDKTPVYILARGIATGTGDYAAIGRVNIKGSAIHAYIAAGSRFVNDSFSLNIKGSEYLDTINPDAGIGPVTIGGNFIHSNLYAGVHDNGSRGITADDTLAVGDAARTARLGAVVIKGFLLDDRSAVGFSGFAADTIVSITVQGHKLFKAGDGTRSFDSFVSAREL